MAVAKVCTSTLSNPGQGGCSKVNPFLDPVMIALTTDGFSFDAASDFATESDWQAGIDAQTVFPLQDIQEFDIVICISLIMTLKLIRNFRHLMLWTVVFLLAMQTETSEDMMLVLEL